MVRDWFRCLLREEAEERRLPEMGLPYVKKTVEVVLRPGRQGGPSLWGASLVRCIGSFREKVVGFAAKKLQP